MKPVQFYQDIKHTFRQVTDKHGFSLWTIAKPEGVTLWWRIQASWAVLKGKALAVHWE